MKLVEIVAVVVVLLFRMAGSGSLVACKEMELLTQSLTRGLKQRLGLSTADRGNLTQYW